MTKLLENIAIEERSESDLITGLDMSTTGFVGLVTDDVTMPLQSDKFKLNKDGKPKLDKNGDLVPIPYTVARVGEPQLITSPLEFKNKFGDIQLDKNHILANAVYGFFINGGRRCWVTRVNNLSSPAKKGQPDQVRNALTNFEAFDEIALIAVPMPTDVGESNAATNKARREEIYDMALDHCEKMKDRFAILDGPETPDNKLTPEKIISSRNSGFGAIYFPWVDISGSGDFVPPSGHIAGIYGRVDNQHGIHKAPANEVIKGVSGVKTKVTKVQRKVFPHFGINIIHPLNEKILVTSAQTIIGDANSEWKYVSVRRLFLFLQKSIDKGIGWLVFQPNTSETRNRITKMITDFLTSIWNSGAFPGIDIEEAFYVKCDEENNPPEVRDLGRIIVEIAISLNNNGVESQVVVSESLEQRVIAFFNQVDDPLKIVERIQDDPSYGNNSPRTYGVRESVANNILDYRKNIGGYFESIYQLNYVAGVGEDTFRDILYSFQKE